MKHEQLLVQYGMIRAAGMRSMDLQTRLNRTQSELEKLRQRHRHQADSRGAQEEDLSKQLREAHLELEGRALEILALKEKVRGLEMLTRNEITNETIDKQFSEAPATYVGSASPASRADRRRLSVSASSAARRFSTTSFHHPNRLTDSTSWTSSPVARVTICARVSSRKPMPRVSGVAQRSTWRKRRSS